ncbi:hypothetical protein Fot_43669 [Forsythia ovata]|uniref:Uncharacterized protein n=1 Tax=Forsythia ovata TaxID=205694 RepID=A0ABD1R1A2_9LAMI
MASFFCKATSLTPPITSSRDEVYVAAVPLRATRGPAQLFTSTAYSLSWWNLQHYMALVYDFQPQDPENISVAVAAISGRKVPGVVLVRKLGKLPKRKCWFVGCSELNAIDAASKFNDRWKTDLRIGHHDCRHYANGLVEYLTGEKAVLEHLRESSYGKT